MYGKENEETQNLLVPLMARRNEMYVQFWKELQNALKSLSLKHIFKLAKF